MTEVIGVKFKDGGKVYFFDPVGIAVSEKQEVIVDTSRGIEFGICAEPNREVDDSAIVAPLRPLVRIATEEDKKRVAENKEKEKKAFDICLQKITEHNLDMKLIDVEYNFDGSKILFFFTSDGRVDFRELVKSLATIFKTRIELRQIGVRDEAKLLGGLGICGKPFCCATFLEDFQPVSIKMAKTQNLSLNPAKISGTCGRLMCCLKYEQDAYESLIREMPRVDTPVLTPDGHGKVTEVSLMRGVLKVRLSGDSELATLHAYKNDEISPLDAEGNPIRPVPKRTAKPISSLIDKLPSISYASDKFTPQPSTPAAEPPARETSKSAHSHFKKNRHGHEEPKETKPAPEPAEAAVKAPDSGSKKPRHKRPGKKPQEAPSQGQQAPGSHQPQPNQASGQQQKPPKAQKNPPKNPEPKKEAKEGEESKPRKKHHYYKKHFKKKPEGSGPAQ